MFLYLTWWWYCTSGGWVKAKPFHPAHLQPKQAQEDLPHPAFRPKVDPTQHHGMPHKNRSPTGKDLSYLQGPTQATVSTTNTLWEIPLHNCTVIMFQIPLDEHLFLIFTFFHQLQLPHGIAAIDHDGSNTGELSFQVSKQLLLDYLLPLHESETLVSIPQSL